MKCTIKGFKFDGKDYYTILKSDESPMDLMKKNLELKEDDEQEEDIF